MPANLVPSRNLPGCALVDGRPRRHLSHRASAEAGKSVADPEVVADKLVIDSEVVAAALATESLSPKLGALPLLGDLFIVGSSP